MPRKHKAFRIELFFCYLENIQTAEHVFHAYFEHLIYLFFRKRRNGHIALGAPLGQRAESRPK